MTPQELHALLNHQTAQLYAGLGEFVAQFELIVFSMREALVLLWSRLGGWQAQALVRPGLSELTADPVLRVFQSSFATAIDLGPLDDEEKAGGTKILGLIATQTREMIKTRNEIVHGTWFIDWASPDDTDFSVARGEKTVNTKSGVEARDISRTKQDFDALCDECNRIKDLINRLSYVTLSGRSFQANFVLEPNRVVTLKPHQWTFRPRINAFPTSDSST